MSICQKQNKQLLVTMHMKFEKQLTYTTFIPHSLEKVFDFFSKAENLNEITPPSLNFNILTPLPIHLKKGALIDYKIRLGFIPMRWKTEICSWNPPFEFTDKQLSGPYTTWIHTHKFEVVEGGVRMTDTILYQSKGYFLAPLLHWLFVDNQVKQIFEYREQKLRSLFK